jgi:hypothetical protein
MNASEASTTSPRTLRRPRPTVEQLLDREEALAIQRLADSVQNLGEDMCTMAELRPRIRRHPVLATGLAALLGFFGGPPVLRGLERVATAAAGLPALRSAGPRTLPGLALAALRLVREQH